MTLDDRLFYLILGIVIGLAMAKLDKISRKVDLVKKELDEVDDIIKRRDESGFMHARVIRDVVVVILLLATSYSSFQSGVAKRHSDEAVASSNAAAERAQDISDCNTKVLKDVIVTLNGRAQYTIQRASSNIDLVSSQGRFLGILLHKPPFSEHKRVGSVQRYYANLQKFLNIERKNLESAQENPLPKTEEFASCLKQKEKED